MHYIVLILFIVIVVLGPSLWVQTVIKRYRAPRPDYPGTGGEFARHLLDKLDLHDVNVESTDAGDHYDPQAKCVRLLAEHFDGKSLSAVVIAAHEVGHAIQDASDYAPLRWRSSLGTFAILAEKFGAAFMFAIPLVAGISRAPAAGLATYALGAIIMSLGVVVHIVTLPVELDASFRRALPLLESGRYISDDELPKARWLLRAAAMTYLSQSLSSLLNLWRWVRVFRR